MTRDEAIARLKTIEPQARALGVTALYLYGSTARNEAGPNSDLDVFVEYAPKSRFNAFDLLDVKAIAETTTGAAVDINTRPGLHPSLRARIEHDAAKVF